MSTTLPLFWHLSSASTDERLDASVKLITSLEEFQANKTVAPAADSDEEEESDEDSDEDAEVTSKRADDLNSEDVKYALRRLIRGLASPRESSRLGFSVALAELLTRLHTVDAAEIISSILESSVTNGSMKGQEIRDTLFARLFGLTAVIQSGLLFRGSHLPASPSSPNDLGPPASSLAAYQTTISELLSLGEKKSWLRESAWWAFILAVKLLHSASPRLDWEKDAVDWTLDMVYRGDRAAEWTPDKLALTLCLQDLEPSQPWKELLSPGLRSASLLSSSNLAAIARILKEVEDTDEPDTKSTQPGLFKVQVHSAWDAILHALAEGKSKTSFAEFYRICVDESLFAATSSPERKSWGFQVFERALAILPPSEFQYLFTPNFMRSWINHLSSPDRHLHKAAKKAASEIVKAVERHPSVGFSFVTHLQGAHGNQQFDRITRTKTVETILASTDIEGVKKYTATLVGQLRQSGGAETDLGEQDTKRRYVVEQLSALMRNGSIPKDDEWVLSILELFILHGFFTVTKKNKSSPLSTLHHVTKPPLSDSLRGVCRTKLFTMLGDLSGQTKTVKDESGQTSRVTSSAADGELWMTKAIKLVDAFEQDSAHISTLAEVDEVGAGMRVKARKVLKSLQKKKAGGEDDAARGAEILVSALLLQTYDEEESENSAEVLESCLDATEQLFSLSKKSKSSTNDGDEAHLPIDLLVDAIVGMLEASSAFGRAVATQAFGMLSGRVDGSTIDLILLQLEQRDVNASDTEDEDEGEGEEVNGEEVNGVEESEDDSEDEGEEDEEEEDEDVEVDPEFRRKVAEALQVNGMAPTEDDGSDSDSEDEVVLDDDQMMQLDEHLAKIFRSQAGNTKEKKGAQREATHFKIRILDLLDVFLNKQPQSTHVPRIILPLVKLIISCGPDERQLSEKTIGILRARIGKLKDIPAGGFDKASVLEDLQSLHELARKMAVPEVSACSIYLSRVLQGGEEVLDIYRASVDDFVQRKNSKIAPALLKDFIVRQAGYAWGLREHITEKCVPGVAVNVYRQMQVWGLIQAMLSQVPPLSAQQSTVVEEFFALVPLIRGALYKTLRHACQQTEHAANAAQMKELFKVALQAVRLTRKIAKPTDGIDSYWDAAAFESIRKELAECDRFKSSPGIQTLAKQFSSILAPTGSQNGKGRKKRKEVAEAETAVVNGTEETEPRKKRKKVKKPRQERVE